MLRIDERLRHKMGIFEFSDDPQCMFRLRCTPAPYDIEVPNRKIRAGEPILEVHLWNEHVPPMPGGEPSVRWAIQFSKSLTETHRAIARFIQSDPEAGDARAVGGSTPIFSVDAGGAKLMTRMGYTVTAHVDHKPAFFEFFDKLYLWMVMRTFKVGNLELPPPTRMERADFWMTPEELLRRFGEVTP